MRSFLAGLALICSIACAEDKIPEKVVKEKPNYVDSFNKHFDKTSLSYKLWNFKLRLGVGYNTKGFSVENFNREQWTSQENIEYLTSGITSKLKLILHETEKIEIESLTEVNQEGHETHFIYYGFKF